MTYDDAVGRCEAELSATLRVVKTGLAKDCCVTNLQVLHDGARLRFQRLRREHNDGQ